LVVFALLQARSDTQKGFQAGLGKEPEKEQLIPSKTVNRGPLAVSGNQGEMAQSGVLKT
jgi:hypothetical protein